MRVGIDARLLQGKFSGDRTYWRGLIRGLSGWSPSPSKGEGQGEGGSAASEYLLYTFPKLPPPDPADTCGLEVRPVSAVTGRDWSLHAFPRALGRDGVQVAHVQYSVPPRAPCPVITSVHDVSFRRCPQFFSLKDRLLLDVGMRVGARRAAKILVLSEFTEREMLEGYDVSPERIAVVYPGADDQFRPLDKAESLAIMREKYSVASPFIVTVGVIPARKNIPCLIRAFALLKGISPTEHKLVIVGNHGGEDRRLLELAASLETASDVLLPGIVPYEDLPHFYNAADLCVYPSLYEGFGLPALEAMACGVPVITGNLSALPEVVGDAGITVDPHKPEAFAEAMTSVLSDSWLRSDMSARGLERAGSFTWEHTARRVSQIYREVAG